MFQTNFTPPQRTVVLLPHPEYAKIYATAEKRAIIVQVLEQVAVEHDIDIDIAGLQSQVRKWAASSHNAELAKYPEPKTVHFRRTPPTELPLRMGERKALVAKAANGDTEAAAWLKAQQKRQLGCECGYALKRERSAETRIAAEAGVKEAVEKIVKKRAYDRERYNMRITTKANGEQWAITMAKEQDERNKKSCEKRKRIAEVDEAKEAAYEVVMRVKSEKNKLSNDP